MSVVTYQFNAFNNPFLFFAHISNVLEWLRRKYKSFEIDKLWNDGGVIVFEVSFHRFAYSRCIRNILDVISSIDFECEISFEVKKMSDRYSVSGSIIYL